MKKYVIKHTAINGRTHNWLLRVIGRERSGRITLQRSIHTSSLSPSLTLASVVDINVTPLVGKIT